MASLFVRKTGPSEAAIRQIKGTCSYVKPQIPQAIFPTAPAKNCTADGGGGGFEGLGASFIISLFEAAAAAASYQSKGQFGQSIIWSIRLKVT